MPSALHVVLASIVLATLSSLSFAQVTINEVDSAKVDQIFAKWDKPDSPGCALGVIRDGAFVYKRGYGQASLEHGVPITPETVFNIGSMSKQFTAASIVLLAQDGRLSLDDDVRKYLPEIPVFERPITLRHLLNHTSGLRDYRELMWLAGKEGDNFYREQELLRYVTLQKRLNFPPGDQYYYSNTGYLLLGIVVKRVSGKTLEQFAEERIFKPLGMTHTHFHGDRSRLVPRRASPYFPAGSTFRIQNPGLETGGTGVMTSVEDLLLWDQNFYTNKLGANADLPRELQVTGKLNNGKSINYAAGLVLDRYRGLNTVSHGGRDGSFITYFTRFPDLHFSVITLCNSYDASVEDLTTKVIDLYLAAQLQAPRKDDTVVTLPGQAVSEAQAKPLLGWYKFSDANTLRRVYYKDGKLLYFRGPGNESVLELIGDTRFRMLPLNTNTEVEFTPEIDGRRAELRVITNGTLATLLTAFTPANYSAAELAALEGDYVDDEFGTRLNIHVRDGQLHASATNANPLLREVRLWPTVADQFRVEWGPPLTLSVVRDAQKGITGLRLDAERVKNLLFVRQQKPVATK